MWCVGGGVWKKTSIKEMSGQTNKTDGNVGGGLEERLVEFTTRLIKVGWLSYRLVVLLANLGLVWRLFGAPIKQAKQVVASEDVATINYFLSVAGRKEMMKNRGNKITSAVGAPPRVNGSWPKGQSLF